MMKRNRLLALLLAAALFTALMPGALAAHTDDPPTINSIDEFKAFRDAVNAGNNFSGKIVTLNCNIDLNNEAWTPIGTGSNPFNGVFDGQGHTISNLNVNMGSASDAGLFGRTNNGEIKNLNVRNATVKGRLSVGVVAGTPYTSKYTNIKVTGHVEVTGMAYVGGVLGRNVYANVTDITVNVDSSSYVKADSVEGGTAYRTYVGGVIGFMGEGGHKVSNVTSNIDVIGNVCDIGGIVGIAHYGNQFENITCTGDVTLDYYDETKDPEEIKADAAEVGGISGVWHNGGADVSFTNCNFTGDLYLPDAVDTLYNNGLTGAKYSSNGSGSLVIDGVPQNQDQTDTYIPPVAPAVPAAPAEVPETGDHDLPILCTVLALLSLVGMGLVKRVNDRI